MANPTIPVKFYAFMNNQLRLVNVEPIDPANYEPAVPEAFSGSGGANTRIIYRPPLISPIITNTVILYNRGNLANRSDFVCSRGTATQLSELLPQINDQLGLTMSLADIVNVPLPSTGNVTLAASPSNLLLFGSTEITLTV